VLIDPDDNSPSLESDVGDSVTAELRREFANDCQTFRLPS